MRIISTLLIVIVAIGFVNASLLLGPGKLYFNLSPGEQGCQKVVLASSDYQGIINVRDVWADSINEMNVNKYTKSASEFGISVAYRTKIDNFIEREELEVCITGQNIGRFRGNLIFTPVTDSNVVVEVGTWLFVNISSSEQAVPAQTAVQSTSTVVNTQEKANEIVTSDSDEPENTQTSITGSAVGVRDNKNKIGVIIPVVLVIIILAIGVLYYKRRQRWIKFGY